MSRFRPVLLIVSVALFLALTGFAPARAWQSAATPEAALAPVEVVWETTGGPGLPLNDPFQLAIDPDGNLWVADGHNSRFQIFSPEGMFLETWGTPGSAEGEFDFVDENLEPTGAVAFDDAGKLYVLDPGNRRVQKFDADRSFITAWGDEGAGDGEFLHPYDIALDATGRVYVIDDGRDDVQVFDGDGRHLLTFGGQGTREGQLFDTGSLAVAADGTVWVADWGNYRVQMFSPEGEFLGVVGGPGLLSRLFNGPLDVAVDDQGNVYVVDAGNSRVQVFDGNGQYLMEFGSYGTDTGEFASAAGIAVDDAGHVYVSDWMTDRVTKFRLVVPLPSATPVASASIVPVAFV